MEAPELKKYKNVGKYVFFLIITFTFTFLFLVIYSIFSTHDQKYDVMQLNIADRQRTLVQRYHKRLLAPDKKYKISKDDLKKVLLQSLDVLINGGQLSFILEEEEDDEGNEGGKDEYIILPKVFSKDIRAKLLEQREFLKELFLYSDKLALVNRFDNQYEVIHNEINSFINDKLNNNTNQSVQLFAKQYAMKNNRLITISLIITVIALIVILLLLKQVYVINEDLIYENKERLKTEQKLKEYSERLVASNKELEHFAFVASHDLQEPLRQIISFGELIEKKYKGNIDDKTSQYLGFITESAYRMRALIDDILELSRVTTKKQVLESVDLNKVVQDVINDSIERIKEKNAKIDICNLPTVYADEAQMRQLFQNLILNSIKYSKKLEPPVLVLDSNIKDDSKIEISFKDNGIGFDQKDSERIFKLFQRLHMQTEYEGTGLGLAICKRIVERHGGGIRATSVKGAGATFTVVLPNTK